jgi:hypothetical protein
VFCKFPASRGGGFLQAAMAGSWEAECWRMQ